MRISDWSSDVCSSDLETGQDADRYRNDHAEKTKTRHDGGAVARDRTIGSGDRDEHRACAVREKHREPHDGADDNSDATEERSEERRVGNEGVSPGRSRWTACH